MIGPLMPARRRTHHRFTAKVGWYRGHLVERCDCGVERTARLSRVGVPRALVPRAGGGLYRRVGDTDWSEEQIPCARKGVS